VLKCKEFNPLKLKVTEDRVFQINGNQEHVVDDFFLNLEDLHYGFNITIANGESVTYYTQHPIIGVGVSEIENDIILIYEYGKSINWKINKVTGSIIQYGQFDKKHRLDVKYFKKIYGLGESFIDIANSYTINQNPSINLNSKMRLWLKLKLN